MGYWQDKASDRDAERSMAADYLVEKEVLETCPHGTVFGGGWDLEDSFWKNAMADRNLGANGPVPWALGMKPREYTDLLKEVYEDHSGDECPSCAKNARDDE